MPWLPQYPETNWGGPPDFRASPIEGLVQLRAQQQQHLENQFLGAIQQYKNDQVANALTKQYEDAGMVPQDAFTGQGVAGATAAQNYIKNQQYRTYPTQIGGQTYPLTQDERVKMAIAGATINARDARAAVAGGYEQGSVPDPSGRTNALGYYTSTGRWVPRTGLQPQGTGGTSGSADRLLLEEQKSLIQRQNQLDKLAEIERQRNVSSGQSNVPFSRADEYNANAQRLQEIQNLRRGIKPNDVDQAAQAQGLQSGPNVTPTPIPGAGGGPQPGDTRVVGGKTYTWDGSQWNPQ